MKNKGIIPINKPKDWTSFDVVNKIKYNVKPLKVGHLGTLDPMATGVLLVTVGKATKLFDLMQEKKKAYVATFVFGYSTDTLDTTGKIEQENGKIPTKEEIIEVLPQFVGKIAQIPPKYSAKSINGVRAYELARQGLDFEIKPKQVEIFNIELLDYKQGILKLEIECGSGTYIRSIGRDIAFKLNTFATMSALVRTKIDSFDVSKCYEIDETDNWLSKIVPISEILNYPKLELKDVEKTKLLNGQTIILDKTDGLYFLQSEDDVIALVKIKENHAKMSIFLG